MDEKALNKIIEASASPPSAQAPDAVAPEPIEVPAVTVEYGDPHTDELGTHTPVNVRCGETVIGFSFGSEIRTSFVDEFLEDAKRIAVRTERDRLSAKAGS